MRNGSKWSVVGISPQRHGGHREKNRTDAAPFGTLPLMHGLSGAAASGDDCAGCWTNDRPDETQMPESGLELSELARELKKRDSGLRVFGAKCKTWGHNYKFNACLKSTEVANFERRHDLSLPDDYRDFLLFVGDGGAGPYYGVKQLDAAAQHCDLDKPFPWSDETTLDSDDEWDLWDTHPGILVITERGCGHTDFLVVRGEQHGQIWSDCTADDGLLMPTSFTFSQWYRNWAERCLKTIERESLLERVDVGTSIDELRQIFGSDMRRWGGSASESSEYYVAFANTNVSFQMATDDTVKEIYHLKTI